MSRANKNFELKKDTLIQLALDLFSQKGYENTTIIDLQKAFGLTKGGMYHYFSSKEEIMDAVIEYGLHQGMEEMKTNLINIPLEDKLLYYFFNGATNDFTQKLFRYSVNNKSSLVTYKLHEQNVEILIPVLQDILHQYIDAGIYQCDYPEEMSEFCVILGKAVAEIGILGCRHLLVTAQADGDTKLKKRLPEYTLDVPESITTNWLMPRFEGYGKQGNGLFHIPRSQFSEVILPPITTREYTLSNKCGAI